MKPVFAAVAAVLVLGACAYYSPANRPCDSGACRKHGTWDICHGKGCEKDTGTSRRYEKADDGRYRAPSAF